MQSTGISFWIRFRCVENKDSFCEKRVRGGEKMENGRKTNTGDTRKITGSGKTADRIAVDMLKSLLCAYIITGILLLILAVLLYKAGISENTVDAGVILIYVISTFSGGFVMGKLMGERKFLWGLILGAAYFILLLLITFGMYHTLQGSTSHLFTVILLCAGGGMMGGMVA